MFATLPTQGPEADCRIYKGLATPDEPALTAFREWQADQAGVDAGSFLKLPTCALQMLPTDPGQSCQTSTSLGWCYVQNPYTCNAVILSAAVGEQIKGATYTLRCQ